MRTVIAAAASAAAVLLTCGTAAASPAPHRLAGAAQTARTAVTARDDSGGGGNWAADGFTRTVTVTPAGTDPVTGMGEYTAALSDTGSFTAVPGALTPNQGLDPGRTVTSAVTGQMTGTASYQFEASAAPDASLVPAAVSGDSPSPGAGYLLFVPAGTVFTGPGLLDTWSWVYTTAHSLRPHGSLVQTWTDAAGNDAGQSAGAGDILGYGAGGSVVRPVRA